MFCKIYAVLDRLCFKENDVCPVAVVATYKKIYPKTR